MCGVKTWNSCITGPTGQLELWYVLLNHIHFGYGAVIMVERTVD